MTTTSSAAINNIMAERSDWYRLLSQAADRKARMYYAAAREYAQQLRAACEAVGTVLTGFDEYVQPGGAGEEALAQIKLKAEASGIAGVPHYVYTDHAKARQIGLFGREHLALIRGKYAAAGLARRTDVAAEFSHAWPGNV